MYLVSGHFYLTILFVWQEQRHSIVAVENSDHCSEMALQKSNRSAEHDLPVAIECQVKPSKLYSPDNPRGALNKTLCVVSVWIDLLTEYYA